MPWGETVEEVIRVIVRNAPRNGRILDLMCGPGVVLARIRRIRPDLELVGVDIDRGFLEYARSHSHGMRFIHADVLRWKPGRLFDGVICTGGIHHLPFQKQEGFVRRMYSLLKPGGILVAADPYLGDYAGASARIRAAAELGDAYIREVTDRGGFEADIQAAVQVKENDIHLREWKVASRRGPGRFRRAFPSVRWRQLWPKQQRMGGYGDYVVSAKKYKK